MASDHEVNDARIRAFNALAKFLDALTDLAGPLARMLGQELADREAGAGARRGRQ